MHISKNVANCKTIEQHAAQNKYINIVPLDVWYMVNSLMK